MYILFYIIVALSILDRIEENYQGLETIQGEIIRHISDGKNRDFMKGEFYIKRPNKLHLNYIKPPKTIILSDTLLWIYLPQEKRAIKIDYANLSQMEKSLLGLESFLGINPLEGFKDNFRFELDDNRIIGTPLRGIFIGKIVVKVDTIKMVIQQLDIFDTDGRLYSETAYKNFENYGDIWFPSLIVTKIFPTGLREEINFRDLKINEEVDLFYFDFIPIEGIEIIEGR